MKKLPPNMRPPSLKARGSHPNQDEARRQGGPACRGPRRKILKQSLGQETRQQISMTLPHL
ncbi:unnamed protein product [Clavelina lepadiformis]|uniref:Uncharacterized protein n=1 Tax=Clavelina lepadiformis TaxID=159417 RepID=A0ABP0G833_CLALP